MLSYPHQNDRGLYLGNIPAMLMKYGGSREMSQASGLRCEIPVVLLEVQSTFQQITVIPGPVESAGLPT